MAFHSNNFIRVRLNFDYPPPAVVDCRMCWLLVDLNTCRVVADLESVIREKFEFGRGSILSLFVEDCYLPHTESVYVVRDNDSLRVKVDCLPQVNRLNSCSDASSESCRKRQRPAEEEGPGENGVSKKKRKKKGEESVETAMKDTRQASGDEMSETTQEMKKKKKKKKKRKKAEEKGPTVTTKPAASSKQTPVKIPQKPPVAKSKPQKVSSSDSSSEEDKTPRRPTAQKSAPKTPSSAPAASKVPPTTKPTQTKPRPALSSSSETSSDEATVVKIPPKTTSMTPKGRTSANSESQQAPPALRSANGCAQRAPPCNNSDSDSEEEIKLVIRRPAPQPSLGAAGSPLPPWGRGRGQSGRGGCGEERGRGAGRGDFRGANRGRGNSGFGSNYYKAREPSCQTDQLTNMSVVLQNGAEGAPKRDYSAMPLLAATPQVGQKIAFKLLELTENYTPEVSEYKEGKIVSFDLTTKQIELMVLNGSRAPVEPGKFDLVYQNPDGSESVEYAVSRGSRVTERWDSLLEPRLII